MEQKMAQKNRTEHKMVQNSDCGGGSRGMPRSKQVSPIHWGIPASKGLPIPILSDDQPGFLMPRLPIYPDT